MYSSTPNVKDSLTTYPVPEFQFLFHFTSSQTPTLFPLSSFPPSHPTHTLSSLLLPPPPFLLPLPPPPLLFHPYMPGFFVTMFWVAYLISPRFGHRFVGYLEEEAVKTYTLCLEVRWGLSIAVSSVFRHCCLFQSVKFVLQWVRKTTPVRTDFRNTFLTY